MLVCVTVQLREKPQQLKQRHHGTSPLYFRHTHETSRESWVCPHFAIYLDQSLLHNPLHLVSRQGILESVPEHNYQRQTFPQLVRAGRRSGRLNRHTEADTVTDKARTAAHDDRTYRPDNLSSIQCFGAAKRFKCFFGPLPCKYRQFRHGELVESGFI